MLLAGGTGSRFGPITASTSKHFLAVYDKPLIYYALTTLILAGVHEVIVVTRGKDISDYVDLLGHGEEFGLVIEYVRQDAPNGIADAISLCTPHLNGNFALALGDNIFHGPGLGTNLGRLAAKNLGGATIFVKKVADATSYGVVDSSGPTLAFIEKPVDTHLKSAVTGLYFFDKSAPDLCKDLTPSARGEFEVTDLLQIYADGGSVNLFELERGTMWFDVGTPDRLLSASRQISEFQEIEGMLVGSPHEAALRTGLIGWSELELSLEKYSGSAYQQSLESYLSEV